MCVCESLCKSSKANIEEITTTQGNTTANQFTHISISLISPPIILLYCGYKDDSEIDLAQNKQLKNKKRKWKLIILVG